MWKLLTSLISAIATAIGMAKDKQLRNDGANAQKVEDLQAENQRLKKALENAALSDAAIQQRLLDGRF